MLYLSILYFQECVCARRHRLDQSLSSCSSGLLSISPVSPAGQLFQPFLKLLNSLSISCLHGPTARASWYSLLDSSNSPEQQKTSSHDTTVYPRENDQPIYIIIYIQYAPVIFVQDINMFINKSPLIIGNCQRSPPPQY